MRAFWRWWLRAAFDVLNAVVGFALAAVVLALCGLGSLRNANAGALVALGGLTALLLLRLVQRVRRGLAAPQVWLADVELGTLLIAATFALIEVAGGPRGLLYPLVYALVGFLVAYHAAGLATYFLVLILATEATLTYLMGADADWKLFSSHASFNLLFALLSALFLRAEFLERRSRAERELSAYLEGITTEANEYRLTSGLSHSGRELSVEETAQRRNLGSVQAISQALYNLLGVAERALTPYTVALLWLDASDRYLKIKELRSQSDDLVEKPIAAGEGLCGVLVKRKQPLILTNLKAGHSGLVYYGKPQPVTDFVGFR